MHPPFWRILRQPPKGGIGGIFASQATVNDNFQGSFVQFCAVDVCLGQVLGYVEMQPKHLPRHRVARALRRVMLSSMFEKFIIGIILVNILVVMSERVPISSAELDQPPTWAPTP